MAANDATPVAPSTATEVKRTPGYDVPTHPLDPLTADEVRLVPFISL